MAATDKDHLDRLEAFRAKRSPGRTPEPFGSASGTGRSLFVVQRHFARQLHYDFRLEADGVLKSWAVPKGPSRDPAEKRLAVQTEDHPIDYADFEGIIPEGNYGAGAVIVWDRGLWVPMIDFDEGVEKGKLLFELKGYKLRGVWTLVKIKKSEKDWLLIKERDAWVVKEGDEGFSERSVFSGLTVQELKDGADRSGPVRQALAEAGAPQQRVVARDVEFMLAQTRDEPFTDGEWLFELKYDGYRLLACREGTRPLLLSRNGHDLTSVFPEIARAVSALPFDNIVLDGEVVAHDDQGLPSFQRLQKRGRLSRKPDIQRAAVEFPATLYVFDLLGFEDFDLRSLPLEKRKELLSEVLPEAGPLRFADHLPEQGEAFFEEVRKMKLEGIVAKKADARYRAGRSSHWLKIRADRAEDFVIVGFSEPKGSRGGFGALHLAWFADGELVYAGRVGTGFSDRELSDIRGALQSAEQSDPGCTGPVPKGQQHHWVEPEFVCEVRYKQWTDDGLLRHPVFLRLRDDKRVEECVRPGGESAFEEPPPPEISVLERSVQFSNIDKVFWPGEEYTKGDLIEYHRALSPWLLPYLQDRPVVMTRYPDGIEGKSFFQKDAPEWVPEWIRTEKVWAEDTGKETSYFICDDVETLLYVINLGTIPLHIWASRVTSMERPDWCILDLDPKDAPFAHVAQVAQAIHRLCDRIDLPAFVKTSGSSGLHVLIPLGGQCTYEQGKWLGQLLARVTAAELPEIATTARTLASRRGRVYVDFGQNGYGKLMAAMLCVRPLPGAPVSMPLRWDEVVEKLDIRSFTIRNALERLEQLKEDPLKPVLSLKPDLVGVLDRLQELVANP
jgi:bifunctional non-homologous end joining protein LigD